MAFMHGNPLYHWIALAVSSVLLLPLAIAMLSGWVPPWMRERSGGLRLRAYGLLSLYGAALANGLPRLVNASHDTITSGLAFGIGFSALAGLLFVLAGGGDSRARR